VHRATVPSAATVQAVPDPHGSGDDIGGSPRSTGGGATGTMTLMRTPDSDDTGTGDAGSLADGFGSVVFDGDEGDGTSDGSTDETSFGSGSSEPADDTTSALDSTAAEEPSDPYDVDPADVESDTDLDLTGDGLVDQHDFHEAVTSFFDFDVDEGAPEPDDGGAHEHHHDDGGL
jgi:hypothetical protein